MRRLVVGIGVGIAVVAAAAVAVAVWRRPTVHHPNVVVVLWDTVRADHTSLYGYERPTTPHLDRLAASSRVYDRAYAPGMWTVPSHGSLFTGLPTSSHGAKVGWLWLDGHHWTVAEQFRASGYATFAWSSNPYLSDQTNLLQGFDTVRYAWRGTEAERCAVATAAKLLPEDRSVEVAPGWVASGHGDGWPKRLVAYKDAGPVLVASFLDWVDQRPAPEPFFAYLNLLEAHHPRIPSRAARDAVADPDTVARALATDGSLFRIMAAMEGRASFSDDELAAIRATYDAALWDLDAATATLIDGLAERGLLDDTIVVVTSDHGENLGDHGMFDHRWSLHQSLVHVPLLIRYPAAVPPGRASAPVSTGDLYGELVALAGISAPNLDYPLHRLGASATVFSELEAPTPRLPEIRAAFPDLARDRWARRFQAIFDGPWKYVRGSDGSAGLYDLDADPGERTDHHLDQGEVAARLAGALAAWERARPKYDPGQRTADDHPGNPLRADPTAADQLRQLGYTEEDP
ncbi:MAG: sulfatase [Myxococcota bacterium]